MFKKVLAGLLLLISLSMIIGMILDSLTYWIVVDIIAIIVCGIAGVVFIRD